MVAKNKEELLRDPMPGTAAAFAHDFGIDLTLIIDRLRRSPEERVLELQGVINDLSALRNASCKSANHDPDQANT